MTKGLSFLFCTFLLPGYLAQQSWQPAVPEASGVVPAIPELRRLIDSEDRTTAAGLGSEHTETISGGEQHLYHITLTPGELVTVEVDQNGAHGIDVRLVARGPHDGHETIIDSPKSSWGRERVIILATEEGDYSVAVEPVSSAAKTGTYKIVITEDRIATPNDWLRVSAQAACSEATSLMEGQSMYEVSQTFQQFDRCQRLGHAIGDKYLEVLALHRLAIYFDAPPTERVRFSTNPGPEYLKRAKALYEEMGDVEGVGLCLYEAAYAQLRSGDKLAALKGFDEALTLLETLPSPTSQGEVLNEIGQVYWMLGDAASALEYYSRALRLHEAVGDKYIGTSLNNVGIAQLRLGKTRDAIESLESALKLRSDPKNHSGEAQTLQNLAAAYSVANEKDKSTAALQQALGFPEDTVTEDIRALIMEQLCSNHEEAGQFEEALRVAADLEQLAKGTGDVNAGYQADSAFARIYLARGDPDRALPHAQAAFERSQDELKPVRAHAASIDYAASKSVASDLYVHVLMALYQRDREDELERLAFWVADTSRARQLLDLVHMGEALTGSEGNALREAAQRVAAKVDEDLVLRTRSGTAYQTSPELIELFDEYQQEVFRSWQDHVAGSSDSSITSTSLIAEVQSAIPPKTVVLEYWLGEKESYVWMITKNTITPILIPASQKEIESLAVNVYAYLEQRPGTRPTVPKQNRYVTQLAHLLLDSVKVPSGTKSIIVVPDGWLQLIPFDWLGLSRTAGTADPVGSKEVCAERPMFSISPSVRMLIQRSAIVKTSVSSSRPRILLIGPRPSEKSLMGENRTDGGVRFAIQEGVAIDSKLRVAEWVETGQPGTTANLFKSLREGFSIIHFATHAVPDNEVPEFSRIVLNSSLSDQSRETSNLFAFEIANYRMADALVVISSCQSAFGKRVAGEGTLSLARSFLASGASSVIAGLWTVDSEATTEFMETFYQGILVDGLPRIDALKNAQCSMAARPEFRDPYYWSGLVDFQGAFTGGSATYSQATPNGAPVTSNMSTLHHPAPPGHLGVMR